MKAQPSGAPVLIFDGDCGFCSSSARFLRRVVDRRRRYAIEPFQRLDLPSLELTIQQCSSAAWFVRVDGQTDREAAAIAAALRYGAVGWRPIGLLLTVPGIRRLAAWGYRWVAANRFRFPGGTPACRIGPGAAMTSGQ